MNRTIICFGDSNTWGYDGSTQGRFCHDERWTGFLSNILGDNYYIAEAAKRGRTINSKDSSIGYSRGMDDIIPILKVYRPFSMLIIMLGTNDLNNHFNHNPQEIADDLNTMINKVNTFIDEFTPDAKPPILIVSPSHITTDITHSEFAEFFAEDEIIEKSTKLAPLFKQVAEKQHCLFLDAQAVAETSKWDGIHIAYDSQEPFAQAVAKIIQDNAI